MFDSCTFLWLWSKKASDTHNHLQRQQMSSESGFLTCADYPNNHDTCYYIIGVSLYLHWRMVRSERLTFSRWNIWWKNPQIKNDFLVSECFRITLKSWINMFYVLCLKRVQFFNHIMGVIRRERSSIIALRLKFNFLQ